jgi:hypothetical protein
MNRLSLNILALVSVLALVVPLSTHAQSSGDVLELFATPPTISVKAFPLSFAPSKQPGFTEITVSFSVAGTLRDPEGRARLILREITPKGRTPILPRPASMLVPDGKGQTVAVAIEHPSSFHLMGTSSSVNGKITQSARFSVPDPLPMTIESIKAELIVYLPSLSPESSIDIANPNTLVGTSASHPALSASGIKLRFLNRRGFLELRDSKPGTGVVSAVSIGVDAIASSFPYGFGLVREDPNGKLVGVTLLNAGAAPGSSEGTFSTRYYYQMEPYQEDAALRVFIHNPTAERRQLLEVPNVAMNLPRFH